jgi:hypothetical protein
MKNMQNTIFFLHHTKYRGYESLLLQIEVSINNISVWEGVYINYILSGERGISLFKLIYISLYFFTRLKTL